MLAAGIGHERLAQETQFFRIGTGTTGGTYFPIGGLMANAISNPPGDPACERGGSCGVEGLIAVAQASSGSVENIEDILNRQIESGFAQADIAYWAYNGTEAFQGNRPAVNLRAIARLYDELVHVVVPADSEIETVADLRGKRVALGGEGSGTLAEMRLILEGYGLSEASIEPLYLQPEEAGQQMMAGELDALAFVGGAPLLAVEDLARRLKVRLLPFTDESAQALIDANPFFSRVRLARDTYANVPAVTTLAVAALWLTSTEVSAETIEGITRALWNPATRALLANGHPRGDEIVLERALDGVAIPLHDGARRFYEEAGLIRPGANLPSVSRTAPGVPDEQPAPDKRPALNGRPAPTAPRAPLESIPVPRARPE